MIFVADQKEVDIPGKLRSSADPGSMPEACAAALRNGSRVKPGMTAWFLANSRYGSR
jgi:hypothetical protein